MQKVLAEFKEFALRGNVLDLAIGVVVGGAFGKIVSSFVGDIVMPLIGLLLGGVNFQGLKIGPVMIGNFLQTAVDFVIIAITIFLAVKAINRMGGKFGIGATINKDQPKP